MRKAKIAAMIFGGVSTCLCGGILGVYSGTSTVGTVAPKNNVEVENIYDVQSEKLANVAAVTSIKTTAVTTTSKVPTTLSVVCNFSADEKIAEVYTTATTAIAVQPTETSAVNETYADYAESVEDDVNNDDIVYYTASFNGLNISGPFIATQEPETTPEVIEVPEETAEETAEEEDFVFEPSTEYFPPAIEYIAPVQENTATETTTADTATDYIVTTTEYTVPATTVEETETTTTTAEITTTETTTTETTTTETTTTETTTTETTTSATTTTSTTTTTEATTSTTTETTTTETTSTATAVVTTTAVETTTSVLPITDEEYILLCNCVANEAGSNWIDVYEKGKVVEVIMNRVNSPLYPNSIYEVITAPYQFTGSENYAYLTTYSGYVTDMVKEAVDLYFNEPASFTHNYFGFYGDGYQNHFY